MARLPHALFSFSKPLLRIGSTYLEWLSTGIVGEPEVCENGFPLPTTETVPRTWAEGQVMMREQAIAYALQDSAGT
jgi:hypothetical protein